MRSRIRRWPKAASLARNTRSRSTPQWACMSAKAASLQMAPISPRWFARRSSSAMSARSQAARGGASTPSAASTARAKANEYATVLSPDVLPASWAARSMERPRHQALYALVHISEPLLQPDDRFAARRKSKMPWLDDAGMHRPHRDLMQALTLGGQEAVGRRRRRRRNGCSQRMADAPLAMIEPLPRIRQSLRLQVRTGPRPRARGAMPADAARPTDG